MISFNDKTIAVIFEYLIGAIGTKHDPIPYSLPLIPLSVSVAELSPNPYSLFPNPVMNRNQKTLRFLVFEVTSIYED